MHYEQIKAEIRMRGTTPAMIAAQLGLSRTTVGQVIRGTGRSARVENYICALLGKPAEELWPNRAKPKASAARGHSETAA